MNKRRRRKCLHCQQLFHPDPRNLRHQRYCCEDACRRASKAASQRRWLDKPENRGYFRGPEQVARVKRWRAEHPGYWRPSASKGEALQEDSSPQTIDKQKESDPLVPSALQDLLSAQPLVLIGLIAHLTDAALQEDIVFHTHRLHQLARDVLNQGARDAKTSTAPGSAAPGS